MLDAASLDAITKEAKNCFLYEDAPEYLEMFNRGLERLREASVNPNNQDNLKSIYKELGRAAHSIKGGAGMAQMQTLNKLSHRMEDLFEALEQGRVKDKPIALEFLILGAEEVQNIIESVKNGLPEESPSAIELTTALEDFIVNYVVETDAVETVEDSDGFVKTALKADLEDCLIRLEELLQDSPPEKALKEGIRVLEEECTLLGQAFSCFWLEEVATVSRKLRELEKISLQELATLFVQEIRQLRSQFLSQVTPTISEALTQFLPQTPKVEEKPKESVSQAPKTEDSSESNLNLNFRIPMERMNKMGNTVGELLINYERLLLYEKQLGQACNGLKKRGNLLTPLREKIMAIYDELSIGERESYQNFGVITNGNKQGERQEFDALEFDQYTDIHTTLQQFQELMVQVQEIREDIDLVNRDLRETLVEMRQSLDNLESDLTQSRIVPFSTIANQYIQPVEKLSQRYNKAAQLIIEGENVLIDQAILEQLRTPLTHLIRNAFDHGLESPQQRQSLGKPKTGLIKLAAAVKGNQIVITVSDDGRGINLGKVYDKALDKGLIDQNTNFNQLTKDQILEFLFIPGFSTASSITDLSGRGMGMDIVKLQIERLRGSIKIETIEGKESRFIIRIPITVNILPLLLFRCQKQIFAIPSAAVKKIISLKDYQIKDSTINYLNENITVTPLHSILPFNLPGIFDHFSNTNSPHIALIITINDGLCPAVGYRHQAIAVDQILDEREFVVKPFDQTVNLPYYISGCTVLGTGQVIPIFDPDYFSELMLDGKQNKSTVNGSEEKPETPNNNRTILVIDDSIAVRKTLNRILSQSGYQVTQCRDGKEAWELLNENNQHFNLALCDLEMPNLDGFSLLKMIRESNLWHNLPVVILTSRETELHRQKAEKLGANAYLTKPFQPVDLLAKVNDLLSQTKNETKV
jgi:type IV pili sensor histidine kinase/response regulator